MTKTKKTIFYCSFQLQNKESHLAVNEILAPVNKLFDLLSMKKTVRLVYA